MIIASYVIIAIAAYLLGSIPTGYVVGKAKGIDIRAAGSGNIGATNTFRVLGKPAGIFVLLVDALKGFLAVWLSNFLLKALAVPDANLPIIAGIFAVLGHNYTCWLRFKGGKGIATTAGVYLALAPLSLGIALATFILVLLITRYVSVGSILAAMVLPVCVWWTRDNAVLRGVTIALCTMAILKHQKNVQRLIAGTENRIGSKKAEVVK